MSSDSLIIITSSLEREESEDGPDAIPFPQKVLKRNEQRTDHYKMTYNTDSRIELVGAIVEDYHKLNRRRFVRGFINWPWRWSCGRQHWQDPRTCTMMIKGID